jgi:uncharacterized protein YegL
MIALRRRRLLALAVGVAAVMTIGALGSRSVAAPAAPPPAFALGHTGTLGESGVPWLRSAAQLDQPWGVGADGDGVWIADSAGRRLLRFASNNRFLDEIGRAGLTWGIYSGPVRAVADVAVDHPLAPGANPSDPNAPRVEVVWMADPTAHDVLGIARDLGEVTVLGEPDAAGADDDRFDTPTGVAVDGGGHLYVSDTGNHRVQVFDTDGTYRATIGRPGQAGAGNDAFDRPARLVIGYDRRLYVADSGNHRIQVFDVTDPARPAYVTTYGHAAQPGLGADLYNRPLGIATDATFLYIADSGNCRVQVIRRVERDVFDTIGSTTGCHGGDALALPSDVTLDTRGHVYVADPGNFVVHQFKPEDRSLLHRFGSMGVPYVTDADHFNEPSGVAVGADGSLTVVEQAGSRVLHRTPAGKLAWIVGQPGITGSAPDRLSSPGDVALDASGRVYVADTGNDRIQVFAPDGGPERTIGRRGGADGELDRPVGLTVAPDGRIIVADTGNLRVQVFDGSGAHRATSRWAFGQPTDVAVDTRGRIYVADRTTHTVEAFDAALQHVASVGARGVAGDDFDHLDRPSRLAVDAADRLYVADTGNDRVQVFTADGAYVTTLGGHAGTRSGDLREPLGLAVTAGGRLYVADSGNHRIQVFDPASDPWTGSAVNGFGRRDTSGIASVASFASTLLAGEYTPGRPATVRRLDPATGDWLAPGGTGFGTPDDIAVADLHVFGDHVYAGTLNLHVARDPATGTETRSTAGGSLWRTADGVDWEAVATGGFGSRDNAGVTVLQDYRGMLYAGTSTVADRKGLEVWRSPGGSSGSWVRVARDGLASDVTNAAVASMAVYTNSLYVGTCNRGGPGQLWRTTEGTLWVPAGMDANPTFGSGPSCVSALAEFGGWFYAVTGNDPRLVPGRTGGTAQIWRCKGCDGKDWESGGPNGLGQPANRGRVALRVFDEPPFRFLYLAVGNVDGLEVWRTSDGDTWEQSRVDGFGDSNNADVFGPGAFDVHDGRLYLGTLNSANGGELWSTAGSRPGTGVPTPPGPSPTPTPRARPTPSAGRAAYTFVDQWPPGQVIPPDVIGQIVDMAIGDDGTVFLLDRSNNRVMRLRADGTWGAPFGNLGRGPERIGQVGAIGVDTPRDRVYVADHASERLLVYSVDGRFVDVWPGIYATGIDVQPNGQLWIADRMVGAVRLMDPSGQEVARFGTYGNRVADQFRGLQDVTVDPDGNLFVSDTGGDRLRGFRPQAGGGYVRFRTLDLVGRVEYTGCSGQRIQALGVERILAGTCIIAGGDREDVFPANMRGSDLYGTQLHTANVGANLYYALATYDADTSDPENETYPSVVRFQSDGFDIVAGTWHGRMLDRRSAAADGSINQPVRLSTAPDGSLMLTDSYGLRVRSPEGRILDDLPLVPYPSRRNPMRLEPALAVGEGKDGRVMGVARRQSGYRQMWTVVYAGTQMRRYCRAGRCEVNPYLDVIWESSLSLDGTEGLAAVAHEPTRNQLVILERYYSDPRLVSAQLRLYPMSGYGRKTIVPLPGDDRDSIWADVDAGPGGRIYVLDTLGDRVQVLSPTGDDLGLVPTPKDAWRVAGGPNNEIYVLTVYGHVVRLASDGAVLSRFVARPHEGVPPTSLVDLAVDTSGWVYTVDELANQVTVFAPEGSEVDVLQGGTCNVAGDKWAQPRDVLLGDAVKVYVSLFGTCGFVEKPTDIVLAVNSRGQTDSLLGQLANTLRATRQIAALTDLDRHRLGVVSYARNAEIEQTLTHSGYQIVMALRTAHAGRGQPSSTYVGLKAASDLFDPPGERQRVVVLVGATEGDTDASAITLAEQLKTSGVLVMVVNGTSAVATGDLFDDIDVDPRALGAGKAAHRRMLERYRPDVLVKRGTLVDRLPSNMQYVAGSASPAATWDASARTLTWTLADLPLNHAHAFSLDVVPQAEGEWPTNVDAVADYVDGWDHAGTVTLPVPHVRVYGALPTATVRPTRTPTPTLTPPPTETPTPRPTREPKPLYLPVLLRDQCTPKDRNADVVLVIDTSGSMSDPTSGGGETKLQAARDAARRFIGQLVAGRDQAAIVQFNIEATVVVPLTDDPGAAVAGLDRLTQATGTRIDLALDVARDVLTGPLRRADNNPVLVLLTDGEPTGTTRADVLAAAARAQSAGLLVFTIGLGTAIDHDLLRGCASRPEWYYPAPDTRDLAAIYDQIAFQIPCVPVWP